jgi:hypothetical protein
MGLLRKLPTRMFQILTGISNTRKPEYINLKVKINWNRWEIKSVGGFIFGIGARNELELTISTNFTPNKIARKDEDCDWLKSILISKHAGSYVPPLSPCK